MWKSANRFLRERYIAEFNERFTVPATEKGTAFRRTARADLNWIFTVHTERVVDKDNTVTIGDRTWQLEKCRFRSSLAGSTVTIHEHLDGTVSVRYGPHVVGRYNGAGEPLGKPASGGKAGALEAVENHKPVSHRSHRPLEIPQKRRDSHFPTASRTASSPHKRKRKPPSASRRGTAGAIN